MIPLGIRVRIRIELRGKTINTVALANSGFETDSPQLLVPRRLLIASNTDPKTLGRHNEVEHDTAGGSVVMHVYPYACKVKVIEDDRVSQDVVSDLVISPIEREVVMSDALIEALGLVLLSPRRGLWRFIDDPPDIVRNSYNPEYW
ncbi:MAG TPA: hypothetical protein VNL13_00050 [Sulfolobales archaeon]|nr:hypothetical protein [Sulfolobales archaeon]